jgi:hypothetical protein
MTTTTAAQAPRWIEYVPVDDLPDHPRNPRDHDIPTLRASVLRFGFTDPPMMDERTGLLAEGHGRKKATIQLRDAGRPTDLPDGAPWPPEGVVEAEGAWLVPIVRGWASRDDTEAEAYLLAGNHGGGWQNDVLAGLLTNLAEADALAGTAFTTDDLSTLMAELAEADFDPVSDGDQPRLDRKFHLVCKNCGSPVDPQAADKIDL